MLRSKILRGLAIVVLSLVVVMAVFGGSAASNNQISEAEAASFEGFLKLDGIVGDSVDKAHPNEIELLSYGEGQKQTVGGSNGGGGGASKVHFSDIRFRHAIDKASVRLSMLGATGLHVKSAEFTFRKVGKNQLEFYKVKLSDVVVTSVQRVVGTQAQGPLTFDKLEASTGAPGISEEVSLNFSKIEWQYTSQNPDGSTGEVLKGGWDLKENKTVQG